MLGASGYRSRVTNDACQWALYTGRKGKMKSLDFDMMSLFDYDLQKFEKYWNPLWNALPTYDYACFSDGKYTGDVCATDEESAILTALSYTREYAAWALHEVHTVKQMGATGHKGFPHPQASNALHRQA